MKRYMKRIFCLLCAMALLAACIFSGCSSKTEATVKGDTIRHEFKTFVYSDSTDYELDLDNGQIKYVSAKTGEYKVFIVN